MVVAKPGPRRVQRDHERVGFLQLLQDPLPAPASGQQVGERAVDPLQHEVRSSSRRTSPAAAPAPRPAGTPPPSARCRRTRPRTAPGRDARPATARPAAARPPSPRSARAAAPAPAPAARSRPPPTAARASSSVNRRSAARISVSSPSSRSRCSPSRRSCRVASTNRSSGGARMTSSSSWRSASPSPARARRRSPARSGPPAAPGPSAAAPRSPTRRGRALPSAARTSADPGCRRRSASSTDSQNRCASRSRRPPTPMRCGPPGLPRLSTTAAGRSSRSPPARRPRSHVRRVQPLIQPRQETIPTAPGRTSQLAGTPDQLAGPTARSSHATEYREPVYTAGNRIDGVMPSHADPHDARGHGNHRPPAHRERR